MYSGCSSGLAGWVSEALLLLLLPLATLFLLLLLLLELRDRPLADLVLFLEALGSFCGSAQRVGQMGTVVRRVDRAGTDKQGGCVMCRCALVLGFVWKQEIPLRVCQV